VSEERSTCDARDAPLGNAGRPWQKGLVSVIVPTAGHRDLRPTLQSLRAQTYKHYELITVLDPEQRGAPWARNRGERQAAGEYLLFLDDDVVLEPEYLGTMVQALADNPSSAYAYCHYRRRGLLNDVHWARPFDERHLRVANYISTMSLIRHEAFVRWDESLERFQDWDLWLTMLESGRRGVLVDTVLFTACYGDDGITSTDEALTRKRASVVKMKHGMMGAVMIERVKVLLISSWRRARRIVRGSC
jgi:glycosyltransferase involved in cell wall biosynthesis